MGVLKDAFIGEVLRHLQTQRNNQTLVLSLNAPHGAGGSPAIRTAWNALKEHGKDEGMKKSIGLQAVLKERPDIFHFHTNERGHNLITLSPSAQALELGSSLPPFDRSYSSAVQAAAAPTAPSKRAAPTSDLGLPVPLSPGLVGGNDAMENNAALMASIASALQPKAKKQKTSKNSSGTYTGGPLKGQAKGAAGRYQDIVWTPEIAAHNQEVKTKDAQMARALFNACEFHGGQGVTVSQLGANFEVQQVKKDPQFRNHKLIDILRFHEDVFQLITDSAIGGFLVNLQPGAYAALPDAETYMCEMTDPFEVLLPERIEDPRSQGQRMQALRIEICHVLHKRGRTAQLNEIGQDQKIQKVKAGLPKALKLIEFIRLFPHNFTVTNGEGGSMDIALISEDVTDQSMIDRSIEKTRAAADRFRDGKGMGRGKSGSARDYQRSSSHFGTVGTGYDPHQALAQSPQQQYLNALAHQSLAAAYGAYGSHAHTGYQPVAGQPGSHGYGFGPPAGHLI